MNLLPINANVMDAITITMWMHYIWLHKGVLDLGKIWPQALINVL